MKRIKRLKNINKIKPKRTIIEQLASDLGNVIVNEAGVLSEEVIRTAYEAAMNMGMSNPGELVWLYVYEDSN